MFPSKEGEHRNGLVGRVAPLREFDRNSSGTAEQLDIRAPSLNIIGEKFALMTVEILLTIFAVTDKPT